MWQDKSNVRGFHATLSNLPGMVVFSDAIARPGTVVVKASYTPHAHMAMLCSELLPCMAMFTPSTCQPNPSDMNFDEVYKPEMQQEVMCRLLLCCLAKLTSRNMVCPGNGLAAE